MINPIYSADKARYSGGMKYRRCGKSGILLPEVSLGLWHNFGDVDTLANSLRMAHFAFDKGITHFDLANNYGPSYGSAEETFGLIMKKSFMPYRDQSFFAQIYHFDVIFDKSLRCSLRRYDIYIILDDIVSVFARLSVLLWRNINNENNK